ncbi:MAG: multiple sugar transport system ATP-binding protein [Abditibacteriota bacterium]|nr:multiple sugar transport system ATP-binding protein [Abditibacteriota bacterium]
MAGVTLRSLCRTFTDSQTGNTVDAVKNLDLEIRDGEFLVLVGPSGCGKTTTLRMVAGLEEATAGEILIGDRRVNDVPPRERNIAMVFQNYALYPHMSVYDNMAFGVRLHRLKGLAWQLSHAQEAREIKADIDRRIQDVAEQLGLKPLLDRKPSQLSGGQRQRVALGRAVVREPQVFLMDEPLSNLDAKLRVQTRAELIKLHRRLGVTTIYVTHDQVEAMTMGQRIVVMKDGLLQQCDTPLKLYHEPVNMFVAGFLGTPSMNFIGATVKRDGDGLKLDCGTFSVQWPTARGAGLQNHIDRKVILGIRPENIHDSQFVPSGVDMINGVRLNVDVIEPMGSTSTLFLTTNPVAQTEATMEVAPNTLVAVVEAATQAKERAPLDVIFDVDKAHIFDPETEQKIA